MAKRAVEVRDCDRCGKEPANTWRIVGPDGGPREIELCDQHGAAVANAYALARPVSKKAVAEGRGRLRRRPSDDEAARAMPPEPIWR
jgi:hypothetical protein